MAGESEQHKGEGSQALKVVGVVLASMCVLGLVCCGGVVLLGDRLLDEFRSVAGASVQGSGVPAVQERLVRDFTGIRAEGLIDVDVTIGDEWSVMVRADDNILGLITTEVHGDTLVFSTRGSYDAETDLHATITMPAMDHVTAAGLGDVAITGIDASTFAVEIEGSGGVQASGTTDSLTVSISGMGDARLQKLVARTAKVRVDGMGDAEVHVTEALDAGVTGMGDVIYSGDPKVEKSVDGMGDVEPAE